MDHVHLRFEISLESLYLQSHLETLLHQLSVTANHRQVGIAAIGTAFTSQIIQLAWSWPPVLHPPGSTAGRLRPDPPATEKREFVTGFGAADKK